MRSPPGLLASATRGAPRHPGCAPQGQSSLFPALLCPLRAAGGGLGEGFPGTLLWIPRADRCAAPAWHPLLVLREALFSLPLGIFTLADTLHIPGSQHGDRAQSLWGARPGRPWVAPALQCAAGAVGSSVSRGLGQPRFLGALGHTLVPASLRWARGGTGRGWLDLAAPGIRKWVRRLRCAAAACAWLVPSAGSLKRFVLRTCISKHILLCLPSWRKSRGSGWAGPCWLLRRCSVQQHAALALPCPCRATRGRHGCVLPPPPRWESWHGGAGQQCLGCGSAACAAV